MDAESRLDEVEELGGERTPEASSELAGLLAGDPDDQVRHAAAIALGAYADRQSVEALGLALQDSSHWVRKEARCGLARIGNPDSVDAVKLVSETDPDEQVRGLASRVLDTNGGKARQ